MWRLDVALTLNLNVMKMIVSDTETDYKPVGEVDYIPCPGIDHTVYLNRLAMRNWLGGGLLQNVFTSDKETTGRNYLYSHFEVFSVDHPNTLLNTWTINGDVIPEVASISIRDNLSIISDGDGYEGLNFNGESPLFTSFGITYYYLYKTITWNPLPEFYF